MVTRYYYWAQIGPWLIGQQVDVDEDVHDDPKQAIEEQLYEEYELTLEDVDLKQYYEV